MSWKLSRRGAKPPLIPIPPPSLLTKYAAGREEAGEAERQGGREPSGREPQTEVGRMSSHQQGASRFCDAAASPTHSGNFIARPLVGEPKSKQKEDERRRRREAMKVLRCLPILHLKHY